MSGTSLDGLDIASVNFTKKDKQWKFELNACKTIPYPDSILERLSTPFDLSALELSELDNDLGKFIGKETQAFIQINNLTKIDAIASHGHTLFHNPKAGFTTQIGNPNWIKSVTNLPVVYDFRSLDIAHGGQGAPLVPIGDLHLFSDYKNCLNLGGIANISIKNNENITAYDISIANMASNHFAQQLGKQYDDQGILASKGKLNTLLISDLNELDYYSTDGPKSLGVEFFKETYLPLFKKHNVEKEDALHTHSHFLCEKIATEIKDGKVLITGGGAYNKYWINLLKEKHNLEVVIPENDIIDFKEALIFAFLGALRLSNEVNILKDVTGATQDLSAGSIL